jgi:hypothetical protein
MNLVVAAATSFLLWIVFDLPKRGARDDRHDDPRIFIVVVVDVVTEIFMVIIVAFVAMAVAIAIFVGKIVTVKHLPAPGRMITVVRKARERHWMDGKILVAFFCWISLSCPEFSKVQQASGSTLFTGLQEQSSKGPSSSWLDFQRQRGRFFKNPPRPF